MTIAPDRIIPAARRTVDDLPLPRPGYARRSACADLDQELFIDARWRVKAKRVCGTCPVRWDCLLDAFRTPDDTAVRGAMTRNERRAWLAEEGIGPTPDFDTGLVQGMLNAEATWDEIGAVYGITGGAMQSRWKRHGPDADQPQPAKPRRHGPAGPPVDTARAESLHADGVTWKAIAAELGVSRNTVLRAIERARRSA